MIRTAYYTSLSKKERGIEDSQKWGYREGYMSTVYPAGRERYAEEV